MEETCNWTADSGEDSLQTTGERLGEGLDWWAAQLRLRLVREGEKVGRREQEREGGREERERWGERVGGRDGGKNGGREGEKEKWGTKGGMEGKRERWKEGFHPTQPPCSSPELTRLSGAEASSWIMNLKNAYTAFASWSSCIQ